MRLGRMTLGRAKPSPIPGLRPYPHFGSVVGPRPDPHSSPLLALLALLVLATPGMGAPSAPVEVSAVQVSATQTPRVQVPADTLQLTLDEAVQRALRHNPAYRRTTNSLELNDIGHRQAWLNLLPQPSLTLLTTDLSWQRQTVAEDFFGNPLENPESQTVQTSRSRQGVSLGFELDLSNVIGLREQGTQARIRDLAAVTERRTLAAEVARAFSEVRELQVALELEEALLAEAERNLEAARRLFTLARQDRTDVLGAELDVVERENAVDRSRAELQNARLALRNLVGDPDLGAFEVVADEVAVFDPSLLDGEALVARAVGESPRILEREQGVMAAEHSVTRGRAEWLPRLNVGFNRNRQEFLRDGSAFFAVNPDGEWAQTLFLQVAFPDPALYFRRQNNAREARIEVRNQEETLRETRLAVEEEVRRLLVELETSYRSLALQERRVALAEERLSLQLQSYRLGQVTFLELQSASEAAAQARRQALEARFGFHRSRVELERVLGEPVGDPEG
ncbi:MAG: TolC family protein [Gemmatimonadales bacterium]|nr:MAG: TolC family protein [Gemmatimonadales bacterium]